MIGGTIGGVVHVGLVIVLVSRLTWSGAGHPVRENRER